MDKKKFLALALPVATFVLGIGITALYFHRPPLGFHFFTDRGERKDLAFIDEAYRTIESNYWDKLDSQKLSGVFIAAGGRLTGNPQGIGKGNLKSLNKKLDVWLRRLPKQKRRVFAAKLVDLVLNSLKPPGRSRLYVKKDEIALKNEVANKTGVDFYRMLGVSKNASPPSIYKAYQQKASQLAKNKSPQAVAKLRQLREAYQTLANPKSKKRYQQNKIATTVTGELATPQILHLRISRFSPTTLDDLKRIAGEFDHGLQLDTLILDLRDNIGGAIDGLPYFLGPFIGPDQYAYEFLHQGKKEVYKTKIGWLPSLARYKKVVVLVNGKTQSSAEVFASVLKKYNVGVLVGEKTRGWGTVEKVFPLKNQIDAHARYSIFLVHHLTLGEDGRPIEGHGVEPAININSAHWQQQLSRYFSDSRLVAAVAKVWGR